MTRGQLGEAVEADGVDKRTFYTEQQAKIADFANKVHTGEITNGAGEKFTTVVQIGIGGSDLGPRAMYLALENWAVSLLTMRFISHCLTPMHQYSGILSLIGFAILSDARPFSALPPDI